MKEKKRVFFTLKEVDELSISKLPQLAELNNIKVNSTSFSKSAEKGKGVNIIMEKEGTGEVSGK